MRITGGKARGIPLQAPKGDNTRPATDRMRESVFASLGPSIEGCTVADLFAGTGAYGLEALSRGAAKVTFFEQDKQAIACLKQNLQAVTKSLKISTSVASVVSRDLYKHATGTGKFDIIFVDPPYGQIESKIQTIFNSIITEISHDDSTVAFELPGNLEFTIEGWTQIKRLGKSGKDKPSICLFKPEAAK